MATNQFGQTQINPLAFALNQPNPRSTPELGIRLLTQALIQQQANKQQKTRGDALTQALSAREFRNPDNPAEVLQSREQLIGQALAGSGDPQLQQLGLAQALQGQKPQERFEPIMDDQGRPIAQRSTLTGKLVPDPRAPKEPGKPASFVNFANPQTGKIQSAREGSPEAEALVNQGFIRSGTSGGLKLSVGPNGEVQFSQGGMPGDSFGKASTGKIEDKIVQTTERIDRLDRISDAFEPRFLEYGTKFDVLKTRVQEKAGFKPSKEDRALVRDFSTFKRRSTEELNLTIRDLSGAAVTEQEAVRLRSSMPDVGDDIFSGDSPTEFKAKLDDTVGAVKAAQARLMDLRQRGLVGASGNITPRLAEQFPLSDYMPQRAEPEQQFPNAPAIGTVENNYRYKGGNPADPNSWEAVR